MNQEAHPPTRPPKSTNKASKASKPNRFLRTAADFRAFLQEAKSVENVAERGKKLVEVLSLRGDLRATPELLQEARAAIATLPGQADIHHQLVVNWVERQQPNEILKSLARAVCQEDRRRLGFPAHAVPEQAEKPYAERVSEWIDEQVLRVDQAASKEGVPLDVDRILSIWRCLAHDQEQSHFPEATKRLLLRSIQYCRGDIKVSMSWVFGSEKLMPGLLQKLSPILEGLIADRHTAQVKAKRAEKERELEALRRTQAEAQLSETEGNVQLLSSEVEQLKATLADAQEENERFRREAAAREARLGRTALAERLRILQKVRQSIEHETREMRLCLEREQPNVAMALSRIANLENLNSALTQDMSTSETNSVSTD